MKRYVYVGAASGELLSYEGAILWHDNPAEMEFLVPGFRIIELPPGEAGGRPLLRLSHHPDMASVEWPLDPTAFR